MIGLVCVDQLVITREDGVYLQGGKIRTADQFEVFSMVTDFFVTYLTDRAPAESCTKKRPRCLLGRFYFCDILFVRYTRLGGRFLLPADNQVALMQ